jgi:adenylosuccinate synthase
MNDDFKKIKRLFKNKFRKVFYELDYLESKINKKEGIIFKNHIFSQDELIDSSHHKKIDSITRKIGDDASNWYARGTLSEKGMGYYDKKREKVYYNLNHLNNLIEDREPTWWESLKGNLTDFARKIAKNMPALTRILIASAKIFNLPYLGRLTTPLLLSLDKIMRKQTA